MVYYTRHWELSCIQTPAILPIAHVRRGGPAHRPPEQPAGAAVRSPRGGSRRHRRMAPFSQVALAVAHPGLVALARLVLLSAIMVSAIPPPPAAARL
jgi:hypothetical protein